MRPIKTTQGLLLLTATMLVGLASGGPAWASPFARGDIMVSAGDFGRVKEFTPAGRLVRDLHTDGGMVWGSAFDRSGSFYATDPFNRDVTEFDASGNRVGLFGTRYSGYRSSYAGYPNSISFDMRGDAYVGQGRLATGELLKFDRYGHLLATYSPHQGHLDGIWAGALAPDNCTYYYTTALTRQMVRRFDVCTGRQLLDLVDNLTDPLVGTSAGVTQIRPLPDGGLLVADWSRIVRLDPTGAVVQTYRSATPTTDRWFGVDLTPDGSAFWAGNENAGGSATEFDLASGRILRSFKFALPEYLHNALTVVGSASQRLGPGHRDDPTGRSAWSLGK